jgi:hypothetical protein
MIISNYVQLGPMLVPLKGVLESYYKIEDVTSCDLDIQMIF